MRNQTPPDNRLPHWLKRPKDLGGLRDVRLKLRQASLCTVCEEARCPNISECFARRDATFLILGHVCTRTCAFCGIAKGHPQDPDPEEPMHVAAAARALNLKHVVITSVTRDDLPDRGAQAFDATIQEVRRAMPSSTVEVLTPDFGGERAALETVLHASPDVFGHNMETVPALYERIRPEATAQRSLAILRLSKEIRPETMVKSGFMVGLGETPEQIRELLVMLKETGVDCVTIGQYLRPTRSQIGVQRYWEPGFFEEWACFAKSIGIPYVASGPMVRSSYQARELWEEMERHAVRSY